MAKTKDVRCQIDVTTTPSEYTNIESRHMSKKTALIAHAQPEPDGDSFWSEKGYKTMIKVDTIIDDLCIDSYVTSAVLDLYD